MDPTSLLTFAEPKIGVPFGLALSFGLAAICGALLLRPWPPRPRRALLFAVILALCLTAAGLMLRKRVLHIDVARQQVREHVEVLGLGRARSWHFDDVQAVVAERRLDAAPARGPEGKAVGERPVYFQVYLRTGQRPIAVERHGDALAAEAAAQRIAVATGWPARRRGYQLETSLPGGPMRRFRLPDGREGTQLDLQAMVRVLDAPGQESALTVPAR